VDKNHTIKKQRMNIRRSVGTIVFTHKKSPA